MWEIILWYIFFLHGCFYLLTCTKNSWNQCAAGHIWPRVLSRDLCNVVPAVVTIKYLLFSGVFIFSLQILISTLISWGSLNYCILPLSRLYRPVDPWPWPYTPVKVHPTYVPRGPTHNEKYTLNVICKQEELYSICYSSSIYPEFKMNLINHIGTAILLSKDLIFVLFPSPNLLKIMSISTCMLQE